MSCTLVLVPIAIGPQLVTTLIASLTVGAATTIAAHKSSVANTQNIQYGIENNLEDNFVADAMNKKYEQQQTICSQYKTIFKDSQLLKKTLLEHSVENIVEDNGKIYGNFGALRFEFDKDNEGLYVMNITHSEDADLNIVNELNEEYQTNVQEQSYMNIKKNLEKQNLKISEEEVLEDNTIMLTVNLE